MKPQPKKEKMKSIIIFIILAMLLLLIIFAEDIIKLQNKNKIGLSENTAKSGYTTTIGDKTFDITNAVVENANPPTMSAGMIPVKWDGTYWVITSKNDTNWYDYNNGQPAYIMLNDGTYQSELIRDMEGKKLAEDNIGAQILDNELGTIYIWLPRYAYNEQGEILHIKQSCSVAGTWTMPEIFTYETEKFDLSLAGIWIEYNPLSSTSEVATKISNMVGEENKYGFIANTVGVGVPDDPNAQTAMQKYSVGAGLASALNDITDLNRTILKIINTNQTEPIKAQAIYNSEKITVEILYFKYGIKQVLNENGKELTKTGTNIFEQGLDNVTNRYIIIDSENNIKETRFINSYIIPDVETLCEFRDEVNDGNTFEGITVIQTADIDMSTVCSETLGSWEPIGTGDNYFAGTYDGGYHTISNLYINTDQYQILGMFTQTTESTIIQNVVMEDIYVKNTYNDTTLASFTGGIAGALYGKIERCGIESGDISGIINASCISYHSCSVGGIVGDAANNSSVNQCYNKADIYGQHVATNYSQASIGGIVGNTRNTANVLDCYNMGNLSGSAVYTMVGGILGDKWTYTNVIIKNCYSVGSYAGYYKGGILGRNSSSVTVSNCYCTMSSSYGTTVTTEDLKGYTSQLGDSYKDDTYAINNGYPILWWQEEWIKMNKIFGKVYYDTTEAKIKVEILYSENEVNKVVNEKGKELVKTDINIYELENLDDITYTYKIIDIENNIEELRINIYIIANEEDLCKFRDKVNAGNNFEGITVIQTADIDMSGVCSETLGSWEPIGIGDNYFAGIYDGGYHTISNLYINTEHYQYLGMFTRTSENTMIQNIVMENIFVQNTYNIAGTSLYTGGIVGCNYGQINQCGIESGQVISIKSTSNASWLGAHTGGITGYETSNTIINKCYNKAKIYGKSENTNNEAHVGGITSSMGNNSRVLNCYNLGEVSGSAPYTMIGGIAGDKYNSTNVIIENCYSVSSCTGSYAGGILGRNSSTVTISNCYCTMGGSYGTTVAEGDLKEYASILGDAYKDDVYKINNRYPILLWQEECYKKREKIIARAYSDVTNGKIRVEIIYSENGIKQVLNENGKELTKIGTNIFEQGIDDVTNRYIIIDNENNIKPIEVINAYIIPDVETLNKFRDEVNLGNSFEGITVIQTADIDMSGVCSETLGSWEPIGTGDNYFAGTYDGGYHTISNLYINTDEYQYLGMFTITTESTIIKNIVMENIYVQNTCNNPSNTTAVGGIAGGGWGRIEKCGIDSGSISVLKGASDVEYHGCYAGGIIGGLRANSIVSECYNKADIYAQNDKTNWSQAIAGGIAAAVSSNTKVLKCYNMGNVSCVAEYSMAAGGIVGQTYQCTNVLISNCYSVGSCTGNYSGGILGRNESSVRISNCYCTTSSSYGTTVTAETLKGYAMTLGNAFVEDTNSINEGYPILAWQEKIKQ